MQDEIPAASIEHFEEAGGAPAASRDLSAILAGMVRRWKLITLVTLTVSIAVFGVLKFVPATYQSTVEILVYDPAGEISTAVQKPISPFVDALNIEAMNTEIDVIKSHSVALGVVQQLGLDKDPEFQPHNPLAGIMQWFGFGRADENDALTAGGTEQEKKAAKLDRVADEVVKSLQVWSESYIIFVSATAHYPVMAQRLASAVANHYLASQREARQAALQRVAGWLKGRVEDLQSRVLATQAKIEKLTAESDVHDAASMNLREQQIRDLDNELMDARSQVYEKRARLEKALHAISTSGDIQGLTSTPNDLASVPELVSSEALSELRQKKAELSWRAAQLKNKLGPRNIAVVNTEAQLAGINVQLNSEEQHILDNIKSTYDIAVRREQELDAHLQRLTAGSDTAAYQKVQELRRVADADRNLYRSYLSQYNDISERRTLQDATARIISPANFPVSPVQSRLKYYALGGMLGLGSGLLLAFLLEYFRPGVRTSTEIERSFSRPVVGIIPLVQSRELFNGAYDSLVCTLIDAPLSQFSEAVRTIRIGLELLSGNPKAVLITSALPGEGKSTAAMLLAASSASAGRKTVLLDCDLHQAGAAEALGRRPPGLSELLRGTAVLADVVTVDPNTKTHVIPAGSAVPHAADLLMSSRMRHLVAELRSEFDYIVMDTPPLLPVVDALALAALADRILMIVEWGQTPRSGIAEAFKILRPEADRVAGIVLNKVDPRQLQGYGYRSYSYRPATKYFGNA